MKNAQRGFIIPLVLIILAVFFVGGGYAYLHNKSDAESSTTVATSTLEQPKTSGGQSELDQVVSSITPVTARGGATVSLHGSNFDKYTFIALDGKDITGADTIPDNATTFSFVVPTNTAGGVHVIQVGERGESVGAGSFTLSNSVPLTVTSASPVVTQGITVTSPKKGDTWALGTTQTITWKDKNSSAMYDINLVQYVEPCTAAFCTDVYPEIYSITHSPVSGSSYDWSIPNCYPGHECSSNFQVGLGEYMIQVCETGTKNCALSEPYFTISPAQPAAPIISYITPSYELPPATITLSGLWMLDAKPATETSNPRAVANMVVWIESPSGEKAIVPFSSALPSTQTSPVVAIINPTLCKHEYFDGSCPVEDQMQIGSSTTYRVYVQQDTATGSVNSNSVSFTAYTVNPGWPGY